MKYFYYIITDEEISDRRGEINAIPKGFAEYKESMMGQRVFFNIEGGELKEVIAEATNAESADRRVEEFIACFHVDFGM